MQTQFFRVVSLQDLPILFLFNDQMDDFSDVPQRLVNSLPLAIAAFKKRTLHYVESILVLFDENWDLSFPLSCLHGPVWSSHCLILEHQAAKIKLRLGTRHRQYFTEVCILRKAAHFQAV